MPGDFHEVRFPTSVSRGSATVLGRRTDIVALRSGFEERNGVWADSRREYDAGLGLRNLADLYEVIAFWESRGGALYGFRFKDWADWKSKGPTENIAQDDQLIGTGTGTQTKFQLMKTYQSGPTQYTRLVTKPIATTVLIEVNGVLVPSTDYSVDESTGVVTLDVAPGASEEVKAGFEFDVPVRFSNDKLNISVELFNAGQIPQIDLTEVKTTRGELDT